MSNTKGSGRAKPGVINVYRFLAGVLYAAIKTLVGKQTMNLTATTAGLRRRPLPSIPQAGDIPCSSAGTVFVYTGSGWAAFN